MSLQPFPTPSDPPETNAERRLRWALEILHDVESARLQAAEPAGDASEAPVRPPIKPRRRIRRPYNPNTEPGPSWLRRAAALRGSRLQLENWVAAAMYCHGAWSQWLHALTLPEPADPSLGDFTEEFASGPMYAEIFRLGRQYLAPDQVEPDLGLPQVTIDAAQSLLWLMRHDRRLKPEAHRLLIVRTEALRGQVARGERELFYRDFPTRADVLSALDRSLNWLRLLSIGGIIGLAPGSIGPEQRLPPGCQDDDQEAA